MEIVGGVYHVMARGNQGQKIFADDKDRQMWLATLAQTWQRTGWRIHAWTLMGNHYHLLLETPEPNLVSGMKWLQGTYTQRYNARHRQRGHLFQGRYRAVPVEADSPNYFQTVSTYIHLNPARAKLIRIGEQKLWEYPWSSYPAYVRQGPPEWLVTERVLGSLNLGPEDRRGYEAYLESRVLELGIQARRKELEAGWRSLRRGWYAGGEAFRDKLLARAKAALAGRRRESHAGLEQKAHDQSHAERMLGAGLRLLKLAGRELSALPKGQREKQVLAWWLYGRTTVKRRWLAERLAMGYETRISQAVAEVESSREPEVLTLKKKLMKCVV
jgi:REP element-mobilizing transposase RayT